MREGSLTIEYPLTIAKVKAAFESIGFVTIDEQTTTLKFRWGYDTDTHFYAYATVPASGNLTMVWYDNQTGSQISNIYIANGAISVTSQNAIIDYVIFGQNDSGIILDIRAASTTKKLMSGIVGPVSNTDSWYIVGINSEGFVYSYNTKASLNQMFASNYWAGNLSNNASIQSAVSVGKFYNNGFADNIYYSVIHPGCDSGGYYTAKIGSKTFLVYNWSTITTSKCAHIAFDITEDAA